MDEFQVIREGYFRAFQQKESRAAHVTRFPFT
jgi:hypothetical protein